MKIEDYGKILNIDSAVVVFDNLQLINHFVSHNKNTNKIILIGECDSNGVYTCISESLVPKTLEIKLDFIFKSIKPKE